MSVGSNVRHARERAGLSVRELARRLGVSASFLSQFELGQSQAAVNTLFAIARELDISLDELLGHSVTPRAASPAPSEATIAGDRPGADGAASNGVAPGGVVPNGLAPEPPPVPEYLAFQTGVRWRRLVEPVDEHVDFLLTDYEPGADSAPADQPQRHRGTDYGYILEGTLTVIIDGCPRQLGPGEAIRISGDVPHRLRNETDRLVRAIWFVTD
ncbi:cupin domain-containing protein [Frankia sp. CNm7]|uniref:helix-turn-helix domain-containing protein n=1 Tax=Frankia nepalensis TaxID=1836974 RepID=UPI001D2A7423|nr:cupin domain-containing protein [Frankia nepalensis]MBL7524788.1 cupin domain-containing protein [Frankia nepalensis]